MRQTRRRNVVAKAASAGQQPKIFLAPHRLADAVTRGARCAHPCAFLNLARRFEGPTRPSDLLLSTHREWGRRAPMTGTG
jgi:hypothetical protein